MIPKNEATHNRHYYRSLIRKMIGITVLVSFTPLILISGSILYYFHLSYREKVFAHLEELMMKHKQNIDSFLSERLADVQLLSRSYSFIQLSDEVFLKERLAKFQEAWSGVFVDLGVVVDTGLQVAYAGPFKLERAVYSDSEWFKQALQRDHFISDVFLGLRGLPHFIVAVRQVEWTGLSWILRATIDFEAFNQLVKNIRIGETGFAFILNRKGEFQTKPMVDVLPNREPYLDLLNSQNKMENRVRVMEKKNSLGRPCIYLMAPLKDGEWILACQQDAADAFSDLYKARMLAILIFVVGGIGIVIVSIVLSRRMVSRISLADREKEMMNEQVIEAGKLASVGELAAGIAHEINNPVAIMVEEAGWIGDLLEEEEFQNSPNLDELKRALNQIRSQGKRCKEITHKLLSFARKTDPKVQEVSLNDLIEDVVGISEQRARYSNVLIEKRLAPDLPMVRISPSEFQQVMLNLINNAFDAMDKGGGKLEITTRTDGRYVVVDVADTGHGIPKANLARIFDPFFTTKPVGKGTGLGLSICYGIIRKMGGEISVNSAVGIGTTFHVRIPKGEEETTKPEGGRP